MQRLYTILTQELPLKHPRGFPASKGPGIQKPKFSE